MISFEHMVWNLGLSSTMQGAGGIGGLLWINVETGSHAGRYVVAYDGNGNVMGLVSASDGSIVARYEYGPFAEPLRATGPLAADNPFRFSTKYTDPETGLVYYGYRYYSPSLGRWLSRDPVGVKFVGIDHLYVLPDSINGIDFLGLDNTSPWELGWEWLIGTGPRVHHFGPGDPFTEKLKEHKHIEKVRGKISKRLTEKCKKCANFLESGSDNYSLAGIKGVDKYLRDYSTLVTFGLTGNLAVTYLGSYELYYRSLKIVCRKGVAKMRFKVINTSDMRSLLHPPIIGYTKIWNQTVGRIANKIFSQGPMSPTKQIIE